jgi:hypothetical protein
MSTTAKDQGEILTKFKEQVISEGIIQEGDTLGSDDETLL